MAWHNSLTDIRAKVFRKTHLEKDGIREVIDTDVFSFGNESWIMNRFAGPSDLISRL